jgi:hypothetical protein
MTKLKSAHRVFVEETIRSTTVMEYQAPAVRTPLAWEFLHLDPDSANRDSGFAGRAQCQYKCPLRFRHGPVLAGQ